MKTTNRIIRLGKAIIDPQKRFDILRYFGLYNHLTDEKFIQKAFKAYMGRAVNLSNPQTFNEKLQWIKLYDRNPKYTKMVDKYGAKLYVEKLIGKQYIIPTLGIWRHFDEIDFDVLPNSFVLKCTHDSQSTTICKDKAALNLQAVKRKLEKSLKHNYFQNGREWPYKDVPPRIIAEKYMVDNVEKELRDYKFYCFGGVVKAVMVNTGRGSGQPTKADYFNRNYEYLDFKWGYDHAEVPPKKPHHFEEMVTIAEKLSANIPEVRVDLYHCNDKIYFGEFTFFDGGGMAKFDPEKWDSILGSYIDLPK